MQFYGGALQLSARTDRNATPSRYSANLQARNVDVGKLVAEMPQTRGKISGIGELTLQMAGSLGSAFQNSLTGTGNFSIRNGRLPGFNLGSLASIGQLAGLGRETPFTLLQGDLAIGQGRVNSNRIHLDSPNGTVDLRGSFGIDGTLNYEGQAALTPGAGGGGQTPTEAITGILGTVMKQNVTRVSAPFSIRGTFSDPKVLPGKGIPKFETSAPQTGQQPAQKKSIFDLFKKP
jgi:uncharacterized protein involved in outer membrane biogenesis